MLVFPLVLSGLTRIEICCHTLIYLPNAKFHANSLSGPRFLTWDREEGGRTDGQIDTTKLISAFLRRIFATFFTSLLKY
jgi:hypothetical protein